MTATIEIDAFVPLAARPRRRARRGERGRGAVRGARAPPRLARDRLDGARARADRLRRRRDRRGAARQSARGRRLVGLADRLRRARARPAPGRAVLAEASRRTRSTRSARSRSRSSARCSVAPSRRTWGDFASAWPWLGWLVVPAAMLLSCRGRRRRASGRCARCPRPTRPAPPPCSPPACGSGRWSPTSLPTARRRRCRYLPFLNPLDIGIGIALAADAALAAGTSTASRPGRWRWRRAPASSGSTRSSSAASITTAACRITSTPGSPRSRCRPASRCSGRRSRW